MEFGLDLLSGAKYPEVVKKVRGGCLGIFYEVDGFGNAHELIAWASRSKKWEAIRVQGVWKDDHKFAAAEETLAINRAKKLQTIAENSLVPIYYSPFCEHQRDAAYMLSLLQKIEKVAPKLLLVNTPVSGGQWINHPKYIDEIHHDDKTAGIPKHQYFFSFDGKTSTGNGSVDADCEEYKRKYSKAKYFFFWITQFNLTKNAKPESKKPRKDRRCKPTQKLINSVYYHRKDKGNTTLPTSIVWKSHSEQHSDDTAGEWSANKPVAIIPNKATKLQLVTLSGKVLATITSSVKYNHGGGWLYRFPSWGCDYANLAIKEQGSPTCKLVADGKNLGTLNPAYRAGKKR